MWIFTAPLATTENRSSAIACVDSRDDACVNNVVRVRYSDPLGPRIPGENGGTGPDALPKLAIRPNGRRQPSEPSNVSLPTESYTTLTPLPPVIALTRSTKFSVL